MSFADRLDALAEWIYPRYAYWSVLLENGKERNERQIDWGNDLVSTGDVRHIRELRLHCPDGRTVTLEITPDTPAFQFKTKALDTIGSIGSNLEYHVIGRVVDKASGRCECFIWDYRPLPGQPNLIAYKSTIYTFGGWRDTVTPMGALSLDVQGFKTL
jgi:hypothetical protein